MCTCFVKVIFKAPLQTRHQFRDAAAILFNNAEFSIQFFVLRLCDILLQGPEGILILLGKEANKWISDD